jgi:hypothetical protein
MTFDGNPLNYRRFMRQFTSKVANNCVDDDERMNYLEQFTSGEAQNIVIGLSYLDARIGYSAALKELEDRYGDQELMVGAYISEALSWVPIKSDNPKELDRFAIFLRECEHAVCSVNAVQVLEYSENIGKIVNKLPYTLHDKWRNIVFNIKERGDRVTYKRLVQFVSMEAKKAMDPKFGKEALAKLASDRKVTPCTSTQRSKPSGSFASNIVESHDRQQQGVLNKPNHRSSECTSNPRGILKGFVDNRDASKACVYCDNRQHSMDRCHKLSALLFSDRIRFLKSKGLCFGCLRFGHSRDRCRNKSICQKCQKSHPTVLHIERNDTQALTLSNRNENVSIGMPSHTLASTQCHTGAGNVDCAMAVVPVTIRLKNGMKTVHTYAFMDPGSNVSFCSEAVARELGACGQKVTIKMDTMGVTHTMNTHRVDGLLVGNHDGDVFIDLPPVYVKDHLPISRGHIPTNNDLAHWSHLDGISLPEIDSDVGLLIGNNVPDAYTPLELKTGPRGSPHGARSLLGWIVWNVLRQYSNNDFKVNRVEVVAIQEAEGQKGLSELYQRSVNMDFPEGIIDQLEHSQDDNLFMENVQAPINMHDGHCGISLPFRYDVILPDNHSQALHRLHRLKQKIGNNPMFRDDYIIILNPADCVSRGVSGSNLLLSQWWLKGPDLLWKLFTDWLHYVPRNSKLMTLRSRRQFTLRLIYCLWIG